jgi:hypothetical protein
MHVDIQTPNGKLTIVATPTEGYMSMAGAGTRSMPPPQKAEILSQLHHDFVYVAQHADDPAFTFTAAGTEKIGDVNAAIVDIGGPIPWVRWYVDPKTGYVLREKYKAMGQDGQYEGVTDLSDWHAYDGVTLPRIHKNTKNGEAIGNSEYKKVELNPQFDPSVFEKPADKPADK